MTDATFGCALLGANPLRATQRQPLTRIANTPLQHFENSMRCYALSSSTAYALGVPEQERENYVLRKHTLAIASHAITGDENLHSLSADERDALAACFALDTGAAAVSLQELLASAQSLKNRALAQHSPAEYRSASRLHEERTRNKRYSMGPDEKQRRPVTATQQIGWSAGQKPAKVSDDLSEPYYVKPHSDVTKGA